MRMVIVSREVPVLAGLYTGTGASQSDDAERAAAAAKAISSRSLGSSLAAMVPKKPKEDVGFLDALGLGLALPAIGAYAMFKKLNDEDLRLAEAYLLGLKEGRTLTAEEAVGWVSSTFQGARVAEPSSEWLTEPHEKHCTTIVSPAVYPMAARPHAGHPILCGHLGSNEILDRILAEGGGTARIHVFNLHEARGLLQRHGGGIIEEGMYLLHPKRENVIVPFHTYHADMLAEMTREARVVMGRIGAKSLIIDTVEGVTFGGEVVSRIPLKSGGVSAEYEKNSNRRVTYEWGSPTFDPDNALKDCVWIQDNAGVMTIVDQRKTSNLTRYEEFAKIDTSFKLSIDVMKLFKVGFEWAETSTYRYEVQFFDKSKT